MQRFNNSAELIYLLNHAKCDTLQFGYKQCYIKRSHSGMWYVYSYETMMGFINKDYDTLNIMHKQYRKPICGATTQKQMTLLERLFDNVHYMKCYHSRSAIIYWAFKDYTKKK